MRFSYVLSFLVACLILSPSRMQGSEEALENVKEHFKNRAYRNLGQRWSRTPRDVQAVTSLSLYRGPNSLYDGLRGIFESGLAESSRPKALLPPKLALQRLWGNTFPKKFEGLESRWRHSRIIYLEYLIPYFKAQFAKHHLDPAQAFYDLHFPGIRQSPRKQELIQQYFILGTLPRFPLDVASVNPLGEYLSVTPDHLERLVTEWYSDLVFLRELDLSASEISAISAATLMSIGSLMLQIPKVQSYLEISGESLERQFFLLEASRKKRDNRVNEEVYADVWHELLLRYETKLRPLLGGQSARDLLK